MRNRASWCGCTSEQRLEALPYAAIILAIAVAALPALVMWPAVSSSAAMSRSERLRLVDRIAV